MTRLQFERQMREIGQETLDDNPDMDIQDCAYDLAACALCNPEVLAFAQKEFRTKDMQLLTEIVADYIAG